MSMIPDDKVQEVRERAAIQDVVADYVSKHSPVNPQVGGRIVAAK